MSQPGAPPSWFPICSYLNKKNILFWTGILLWWAPGVGKSGSQGQSWWGWISREGAGKALVPGKVTSLSLKKKKKKGTTPLATKQFIYKIYILNTIYWALSPWKQIQSQVGEGSRERWGLGKKSPDHPSNQAGKTWMSLGWGGSGWKAQPTKD